MLNRNLLSKEILTTDMEAKIVKVTDKGQISIPTTMQKSCHIKKGDRLLIIQEGKNIVIKKVEKSEFRDLLKHSEKVAERLWRNKEDDIWDTV